MNLYTAEQVRQLDRAAIATGLDGYALMQQAAEAAFVAAMERWPQYFTQDSAGLIILCGKGNNGGDGLAMALLARQHQAPVQLVLTCELADFSNEAAQAAQQVKAANLPILSIDEINWQNKGLIIDALLGTGLTAEVKAPYKNLIEQVNVADMPVLSVDVPSGLHASTGQVLGAAIKADMTVTMIAHKQGLFTGSGPVQAGDIRLAPLKVPKQIIQQEPVAAKLTSWQRQQAFFTSRKLDSHKGDYGHVLIIGGDHGMAGAAILATGAALRCGAGLVSVATRCENISPLLASYPEAMVHGIESGQALKPLLSKADVVVIGPGLGQGHWAQQCLQQVFSSSLPLVLDADALNLLAKGRIQHNLSQRVSIMTPHPGEAARLLGVSVGEIQQDRFVSAKALADGYHSTAVLKGLGTLISTADKISICQDGNPGMASGGMGDVLSGIMGSVLAQNHRQLEQSLHVHDIVSAAVCLHSAAADQAARDGQAGLLASDVIAQLKCLLP